MGYTHYWRRSTATQPAWAEYISDISSIVKYCTGEGIPLANGFGDEGSLPIISSGEVAFNGAGEEAHETFMMLREEDSDGYFRFCKTAYKPYDMAVCLALIMAKKRFGKDIEVSSDGGEEDWKNSFDAALRVFKVSARFDNDSKGERLEVD
jgi:hypothetical protein